MKTCEKCQYPEKCEMMRGCQKPNPSTAPPFPDQGGGELSSVVRLLNDAAAIHENVAKRGDKTPCGLTGDQWQTQQAAIYRYVSFLVESSLSEPLTQSEAEDVQERPLSKTEAERLQDDYESKL